MLPLRPGTSPLVRYRALDSLNLNKVGYTYICISYYLSVLKIDDGWLTVVWIIPNYIDLQQMVHQIE